MKKLSLNAPYFQLYKPWLKYGPAEAILLAYVWEFQSKGLTCFASRTHIAQQLHYSETRVQDLIKRLAKEGVLSIERSGGKRFLVINEGIGIRRTGDRISPPRGSESTPLGDRNPIHTKKEYKNKNYKEKSTKNSVLVGIRSPADVDDDWNPFS